MEIKAAGGTRAPLILDWLIWLSIPKVNAEWENPKNKEGKIFRQDEGRHESSHKSSPHKQGFRSSQALQQQLQISNGKF